jgi:MFS transporter, FHS family, Na+ dependent glucose transporter 1
MEDKTVTDSVVGGTSRGQAPSRRALAAAYYLSFVSLGLFAGALGPTLPSLATQTRVRLSEISLLLTDHGLGYAAGSLLAGRVYDRIAGHKLMAGALGAMCLAIALLPVLPWLWVLTAAVLVVAVAGGFLDVGANTLLIWAYRTEVAPAMNGLHLFFGVGSLIGPLIVAQVILWSGDSRLTYWVLAPLMIPAAGWLLRLRSPAAPPTDGTLTGSVDWLLVALLALFNLFSVGAESSFANWVYSYSTALAMVSKTGGAYLTSTFWAAFTVSRGLGVAAAMRWTPRQMLLVCLPGALLGVLAVMLLPGSSAVLWAGTVVFGLGLGPLFPAVFSLAGQTTRVTGQVTSAIFVGGSLGMMTIPWVIGQLFEPVGPRAAMVTVTLSLAAALAVLAAVLNRAQRRHAAARGDGA